MKPDVTVIGGGILGLATAFVIARRGARVRLVERAHIGAGASGGLVGALAPHVPENWNPKKDFQFRSLLLAAPFWADVSARSGMDPGYARRGRLQPLADSDAVDLARRREAEARLVWGEAAEWRVRTADEGWAGHSPTGLWVHDTLSARLNPRRALAALAAAIRALGGQIDEGQTPDAAMLTSGPVIWATGVPGLADLSDDLGHSAGSGIKGQAALLACMAVDRPQLFVGGLHIVPHDDGTVAIGSTSERSWNDAGGTDTQLDDLIARARSACPALATAVVVDRWAGLRPRAASRAPVLGHWPGRTGHFIANGGFKIGFGMAPLVGETMADLVLENRDTIPAGFRVEDNRQATR